MIKYHKLVRDKIPEILSGKNIPYKKRIAGEEEYKKELIKKLKEETYEFIENPVEEELADIIEVIMTLKGFPEYSKVENIRKNKFKKRGGFKKRVILKGEKQ